MKRLLPYISLFLILSGCEEPVDPPRPAGSAPEVSVISISGQEQVDSVLTGAYVFEDPDGDLEMGSIRRWFRADDTTASANRTEVAADTGSYTLSAEDEGKYIIFEITPVSVPTTALDTGLAVTAVTGAIHPPPVIEYPPGLYVEDGKFKKEGKEIYGIGINYFNLFYRDVAKMAWEGKCDTSSFEGLRKLSEAGIPFVRFNMGGYWPIDYTNTYLADKELYFEHLDRVIKKAEQLDIGLIPSVFWNFITIPDLQGEHMDQYGNDDSKTIEFIRSYTREVVERYKNSPAIWGWEFGNEMSLYADLGEWQPEFPIYVAGGTPASRDPERDYLKGAYAVNAFEEFAEVVRLYDQTRPIFSGNAQPRPYIWNNTHGNPGGTDTEAQYKEIILRDNPDPMNTITIRGYYGEHYEKPLGITDYDVLVGKFMAWSAEFGRPLFIGEFGANEDYAGTEQTYQDRINTIVGHKVQLSAVWNFDMAYQTEWSITFENSRSYMLDRIIEANQVMGTFGDE
ncbi:MAG: cellulase family glycosylhydrolase [Bacteroidota bacterium]